MNRVLRSYGLPRHEWLRAADEACLRDGLDSPSPSFSGAAETPLDSAFAPVFGKKGVRRDASQTSGVNAPTIAKELIR
jgi:hypothetical protein